MPDSPRDLASGEGAEPDGGERTRLAPWQKVAAIVGLLVVLVVLIALIVGGGHTPPVQHGIGRWG